LIRVVDYGVGNIQAFLNMFKRLDLPAERARTPQDLMDAKHLILPGVGAFDTAMRKLNESGLRQPWSTSCFSSRFPCWAFVSVCKCWPAAPTRECCPG
jgi:glutamine amidotransferase